MSNAFTDARMFWTTRAGTLNRTMQKLVRDAFKAELKPKGGDQTRRVNDLADGRLIALWVAAAVKNPEWGERMVAWTLDRNDPNIEPAIREIYRTMTFGGQGDQT